MAVKNITTEIVFKPFFVSGYFFTIFILAIKMSDEHVKQKKKKGDNAYWA